MAFLYILASVPDIGRARKLLLMEIGGYSDTSERFYFGSRAILERRMRLKEMEGETPWQLRAVR